MKTKFKVFKTNAALAHRQYAYLIQISDVEFLCIHVDNNYHQDYYIIGEIVIFSINTHETYLEPCDYDITKSPLYGGFLFDHFLNTFEQR